MAKGAFIHSATRAGAAQGRSARLDPRIHCYFSAQSSREILSLVPLKLKTSKVPWWESCGGAEFPKTRRPLCRPDGAAPELTRWRAPRKFDFCFLRETQGTARGTQKFVRVAGGESLWSAPPEGSARLTPQPSSATIHRCLANLNNRIVLRVETCRLKEEGTESEREAALGNAALEARREHRLTLLSPCESFANLQSRVVDARCQAISTRLF